MYFPRKKSESPEISFLWHFQKAKKVVIKTVMDCICGARIFQIKVKSRDFLVRDKASSTALETQKSLLFAFLQKIRSSYIIKCTSIRLLLENAYRIKSKLVVKHRKVEDATKIFSINSFSESRKSEMVEQVRDQVSLSRERAVLSRCSLLMQPRLSCKNATKAKIGFSWQISVQSSENSVRLNALQRGKFKILIFNLL